MKDGLVGAAHALLGRLAIDELGHAVLDEHFRDVVVGAGEALLLY